MIALLLSLGLTLQEPGEARHEPQNPPLHRPDVLVIVLDDVSRSDFDELSLPVMHRLRGQGLEFPRGYSAPNCSPSRFCIQFGQYGVRQGIGHPINLKEPLAPVPSKVISLAELLGTAGYRTLHTGKWHLSSKVQGLLDFRLAPNLHGYQDALAWSSGNLPSNSLGSVKGKGYFEWIRYDNGSVRVEHQYATTAVVDQTIRWWQGTRGPRFAHVALHAPHQPYHLPPVELSPPGPAPTTLRGMWEAMLYAADKELGRLLRVVDLETTYVFLVGDNGTPSAVYADPKKAKGSAYEGGVNVPFVVAGPGLVPGRRRHLVHLVDLFPTLCDLGGIPMRPFGDGVSFAGALEPARFPDTPRDWVFVERFAPNSFDLGIPPLSLRLRAVRTDDDWKLIRRETAASTVEELYRLPDEETQVFNPLKANELRAILTSQ